MVTGLDRRTQADSEAPIASHSQGQIAARCDGRLPTRQCSVWTSRVDCDPIWAQAPARTASVARSLNLHVNHQVDQAVRRPAVCVHTQTTPEDLFYTHLRHPATALVSAPAASPLNPVSRGLQPPLCPILTHPVPQRIRRSWGQSASGAAVSTVEARAGRAACRSPAVQPVVGAE